PTGDVEGEALPGPHHDVGGLRAEVLDRAVGECADERRACPGPPSGEPGQWIPTARAGEVAGGHVDAVRSEGRRATAAGAEGARSAAALDDAAAVDQQRVARLEHLAVGDLEARVGCGDRTREIHAVARPTSRAATGRAV